MAAEGASGALLITQYYEPEPIGSAPICTDLASCLAARGTRVTVLTSRPSYPDRVVPPAYRGGARDSERSNGVAVERVAPFLAGRSALGRMATDAAFLARGALALATRRVRPAALVISVSPSVLSVLLGGACARRGARHVAIVHDIESGIADGLGMVQLGLALRAFKAVERFALDRADLVIAPSARMRDRLVELGIKAPVRVVPLWVDAERIRPLPAPAAPPKTILYSGNIGRKQGLGQILDLAEALRPNSAELRIVIRGSGGARDALAREAAARGLGNIAFAPLAPPAQLAEGLAEGHIHLVPQDPRAADFAIPSKIFGIMAAGRPFVATAGPGSALWELQKDSGAFLCVAPYDIDAFADTVLRLARDDAFAGELGRRGRHYVETHYARDVVTRQLLGCIEGAG